MPTIKPSSKNAPGPSALHTASLSAPGQRFVQAHFDQAVAIGTPAGAVANANSRQHWAICADRRPDSGCVVVAPVLDAAIPAVERAVDLILEWQTSQGATVKIEGSGMFSVEFSSGVLWWCGDAEGSVLAVVDDDDSVHFLGAPEPGRVRSEPLKPGDRVVLMSGSLSSALSDAEFALEMALGDDPTPAASCTWLLDAADGDGATNDMYVAVWRYLN